MKSYLNREAALAAIDECVVSDDYVNLGTMAETYRAAVRDVKYVLESVPALAMDDNEEGRMFTEEEVRIANLHGWYMAIMSASSSPRMNKPQLEVLRHIAYPKLHELESLGLGPVGGRGNPENTEYYEWVDAQ